MTIEEPSKKSTRVTEPPWLRKINTCPKNYSLSFKEMDGVYRYLRSTYVLIGKNEWLEKFHDVGLQVDVILKNDCFASLLVIKKIIHSLTELGVGPEQPLSVRKKRFKIPKREYFETEESRKLNNLLKSGAKNTNRNEWSYRLITAMNENINNGWFPLFGTYTVDPKMLPEGCVTRDDLWKKTPAWDRFIKRFKTAVAESCGYGRKPSKWPLGHTFFQYFAIIEHGASGEHPHVHVLFMLKDIPKSWKIDPNSKNIRTIRDIAGASALWPHGWKRLTCGVFCSGSWFAENWIPPIDDKTGHAIEIGSVDAMAFYVTKYMQKGETKKWNHRVKATKSLGLRKLQESLTKIDSASMVRMLACRQESYSVMMEIQALTQIPLSLVRKCSKIEWQKRLYSSKNIRAEKLLSSLWVTIPSSFYTALSMRVRDGLRLWKLTPEQRYNCYTPMLVEVGSMAQSDGVVKWLKKWLSTNFKVYESAQPCTLMLAKVI